MDTAANTGLVAPSDIAELAGVTRAAVSNWRKRRTDFPEPVSGTLTKPLFNRREIEQWLVANGYELQGDTGGLTVWALINRFRGEVHTEVARPLVQAVLCARKLADATSYIGELTQAARRTRLIDTLYDLAQRLDTDPRWHDLVTDSLDMAAPRSRAAERLRSAQEQLAGELFLTLGAIDVAQLPAISDHVLDRFRANEGRIAGEYGIVDSQISRLLAQAASGSTGLAYDPACGIGEALLRLWQESSAFNRLRLVGTDNNPEAVLYARQRCFLYGADATIEHADVLEHDPVPGLLADVVIAEPPFGLAMPPGFTLTDPRWALGGSPPKSNSETAWLQHAIAHLAPGGHGFVVTGPSSTSAATTAHIRRALVRARCIEAIVALPPKLLLHTAIPTALWVLNSPEAPTPTKHVTFIDMSRMDPAKKLPIRAWLSRPQERADESSWARISIEDVLADDEANLNPRRWVQATVDPSDVVERYQRAVAEASTAIEFLRQDNKLSIASPTTSSLTVTVRSLEKQGAIQIAQGRGKGRRDDATQSRAEDPWTVTTRMVKEGLPALPQEHPADSVADSSPFDIPTIDFTATEPGDVLVTTMRTIRTQVDDTGGRTLGSGVIRVRVDPNQLEPHYVAECLAGSWNQHAETGNYIPHIDVRGLQIPLLPIEQQINVVNYLRRVRSIAAAGRMLATASDDLAQAQLDAIRFDVRPLVCHAGNSLKIFGE